MSIVRLTKLHCHLNDEADSDEIYLKYNNSKIWPLGFFKAIISGDIVNLDITLKYVEGEKTIEIWDYDYLSRNDLIGTFELNVEHDQKGQFQSQMKSTESHKTASYVLDWEIL
jgi:lysyl-tRNA synthetase class II